MKKNIRFIWICPLCGSRSNKSARSHFLATKYGNSHLRYQHCQEAKGVTILIKKIEVAKNPNVGVVMEPISENKIWYEILSLPNFVIKPADILLIPGHRFVKKEVYQRICKEGA